MDTLRRPIHDLRISVMDRCNFRCPYCMPRETFHESYRFLKSNERLDFAELLRLARVFVRAGVKKLRITGGEPLLRPNLADLIGDLTSLPGIEDIALTTNGMLLAKYATELKAAGLKRITVSLDTLDPDIFAKMSGGFGGVAEVLDGIEHARRAGLAPIKVNTVVQRGVNDHTLLDLLALFSRHRRHRALHRIHGRGNAQSLEPRAGGAFARARGAHHRALADCAAGAASIAAKSPNAMRTRTALGEVGFISSVSQPFCGDCSRARISSDGSFYTCLFATQGMDLRGPLRAGATDDELFELIRGIWSGRRDRYSELRASMRDAADLHKVEMNYIGG